MVKQLRYPSADDTLEVFNTRNREQQGCYNLIITMISKALGDYCYSLLHSYHDLDNDEAKRRKGHLRSLEYWFFKDEDDFETMADYEDSFLRFAELVGLDIETYRRFIRKLYKNRNDRMYIQTYIDRLNLKMRKESHLKLQSAFPRKKRKDCGKSHQKIGERRMKNLKKHLLDL